MDNNNNVTGFKSVKVDALLVQYDKAFDVKDRIRIISEIDGIVANSYNYILHWTAPFTRIAYWNKFGTPPGYLTRTGDSYTAHAMWWVDPDKDAKLKNALRDSSIKLEVGTTDDHYWDDYAKDHPAKQ